MASGKLIFPADFRWGTATSSHQVEGSNTNNDWWAWEQNGETAGKKGARRHILDGSTSGQACNWWENAEADLDIAADIGTNAHRLSLEWGRIEPQPSVFDAAALNRYREIIQAMIARGIEPMVTLHHFSNPLWLVEKGDFNSDLVVDYFQRYVARVVDALGDLVPLWITINEPVVYAFQRYLAKVFPQGKKSGWPALLHTLYNLLRCHAAAYHIIKEHYPAAQIGVAKNMAIFEGWPPSNRLDRWWAGRLSYLFNDVWMQSMASGRLVWPLRGRIPNLTGTFDFVGLDYYTRFYTRFPPPKGFIERKWPEGAVVSDGNFGEVYPYGLYRLIRHTGRRYRKPIYITENGVPDQADRLRPGFILDHLRQIWHTLILGYPVMGYYHWTLVDNFEWDRGWTQRFGLVELDPETQLRTWRPSAHLYSEICRSGTISSEMVGRYAADLLPVMFPGELPAARLESS
jgi:beta-glucosidase